MRRSFASALGAGILPVFLGFALAAQAQTVSPTIRAESAILIDAKTGEVLFEKNADEPLPVASTQKLLTALLVVESGDLDAPVTIEKADTEPEPTKLYIKEGEVYTRRDLLTALLVRSFNDVAYALARDNAGSIEAFADKMNKRAFVLGAEHSHFVNPNGLPAKDQVSSARDMANIARAVYEIPCLREIMTIKYMEFHYPDGRVLPLKNTNRVMRENDFCNGMKTGYTVKSGHCLVASGIHEGREVIAVVLGSIKAHIWREAENLLRFGLHLPIKAAPASGTKSTASKRSRTKK